MKTITKQQAIDNDLLASEQWKFSCFVREMLRWNLLERRKYLAKLKEPQLSVYKKALSYEYLEAKK